MVAVSASAARSGAWESPLGEGEDTSSPSGLVLVEEAVDCSRGRMWRGEESKTDEEQAEAEEGRRKARRIMMPV